VIFVARPKSQIGVLAVLADEDDFGRPGFRNTAVVEAFIEGTTRYSEISCMAVNRSACPEVTGAAAEIRHAEQIVAETKVQREIRADLPIIFEEEIEFVLVIFANLAAGVLGLARMVIRLLIVDELRVSRLPGFEPLRCAADGSG